MAMVSTYGSRKVPLKIFGHDINFQIQVDNKKGMHQLRLTLFVFEGFTEQWERMAA